MFYKGKITLSVAVKWAGWFFKKKKKHVLEVSSVAEYWSLACWLQHLLWGVSGLDLELKCVELLDCLRSFLMTVFKEVGLRCMRAEAKRS